MKTKLYVIITCIVLFVFISSFSILFFLSSNDGLLVDVPETINVYAKSLTAKNFTVESDKEKFNNILKAYENMTKFSYYSLLSNGLEIHEPITQDEKAESGTWKQINTQNYYCVEFVFKDVQSQLLTINGNTKIIDFYSIIFIVEDLDELRTTAIYYSMDNSQTYTYLTSTKSYPFLVRANTKNLFNVLQNV